MALFLTELIRTTATQLIGLLGIFFVIGYGLSWLQEKTQRLYQRTVGWKGILWTAWIGTPVHELGHVFFAKLFRHKITEVSLFRPNPATGGLGHVNHSYRPYSLYQRIGNFFIGAAPMIMGSIVLLILLYTIVPNGREIFLPLAHLPDDLSPALLFSALRAVAIPFFDPSNLGQWQWWVFLYVSFCVVSHIAPSPQDRKAMWQGLSFLIIILLIVNAIALAFKANLTTTILSLQNYLGLLVGIFLYAMLIAVIHFAAAHLILFPFRRK